MSAFGSKAELTLVLVEVWFWLETDIRGSQAEHVALSQQVANHGSCSSDHYLTI
jgi:hypothetical protein